MRNKRLEIASQLAREVHEAEAAIDQAIARVGVLMSSLPRAQADAKLSAVAGDKAFGHLQAAASGMLGSRSNMVALHNELARIKDKVGLRNVVVGIGDAGKLLPSKASIAGTETPTPSHIEAA